MIIKRNVYFSAVDEETGEEKLYSTNEVIDEEAYLERLYSETKKEEKMSNRKKAAIAVGSAALTAAAIVGGKKAGRALESQGAKILNNPHVNPGKIGEFINKSKVIAGKALQAPADVITKGVGKAANSKAGWKVRGYVSEAMQEAEKGAHKVKGKIKK